MKRNLTIQLAVVTHPQHRCWMSSFVGKPMEPLG